MASLAMRVIRLLRGSLVIGSTTHGPGKPFPVEEDLFQWLQERKSDILEFVEVFAAEVVEDVAEKVVGDLGKQGQEEIPTPLPDPLTHSGEGKNVTEEPLGDPVAPPALDAPVVALASIDATVTAALVAAGFDTPEKLKAATVEELVQVKGIGKVRAEAILAEARGA